MSRYIISSARYRIAYGFDPIPNGGYFFQVYDKRKQNDEDEGLVFNEGYCHGIDRIAMLSLMANIDCFDIKPTPLYLDHMILVRENKQI